jgi:hypothetical protein
VLAAAVAAPDGSGFPHDCESRSENAVHAADDDDNGNQKANAREQRN